MDKPEDELKDIYEIINKIDQIVENGNLDYFKDFIRTVNDVQNKILFRACCENLGIDIISIICKHNKKKLLSYLLQESNVLPYLTTTDKCNEIKYRGDAFYYAMCVSHFEIIEMLYDHWTGDLHWLGHKNGYNEVDVENLKHLKCSLDAALEKYITRILGKTLINRKIDQYMMHNVQSLLIFNEFQIDIYTKLNTMKKKIMTWENETEHIIRVKETYAIRNMIISVIASYKEHTKKPEIIRKNSIFNNTAQIQDSLNDTSTLLHNTPLYVVYETFFRKLDYNICLLILDNLYSLKLRLSMPDNSYQKLENKVYLFIYHVSSKWSLYLPKKKKMKTATFLANHHNFHCLFSLKYNANVFERSLHVICLERRDFENAVNCFKTNLEKTNVEENLRMNKIELPNEDVNCLMLLPDLRDIYSLKRMSQHIAQLYSIDVKYKTEYVFLLVERTLQIVGEFLKSTYDTQHLQPTTEALIKVEISVEVVNKLKKLRDLLCHVKDGELLKRIETERNHSDIFYALVQELKFIKKKIDKVIVIHKPFVEKALILNGLTLIDNRKNEMPYIVATEFYYVMKFIRLKFSNITKRLAEEKKFYQLLWEPKGYTQELMGEVKLSVENSLHLEVKEISVTKNIRNNLKRNFYTYKDSIQKSLDKIMTSKHKWKSIIKTFKDRMPTVTLQDFPNESDANRIKSYAKKFDLEGQSLSLLIKDITLFSDVENHWKFIRNLLEFIILKAETENQTTEEVKNISKTIKNLCKNYDVVKIVNDYFAVLERKLGLVPHVQNRYQCPEFIGIKKLTRKLTMGNFVTQKEKIYLNVTLQALKRNGNEKKYAKIDKMIEKINENVAIPKRELTSFSGTLKLDTEVQNCLMNLVMGFKRDPLIPWCLSSRIALLKQITQNQSMDQLIARYKLEKYFRVLLEVLLFDIFVALEDTENKELTKKSSKLLTEINLRNILIHGNALLEIVGNVLDSNDLPTELITKALDFIKDEPSINALCLLMEKEFDFTQINSNTLSPEQETLVFEFKASKRWREYLKLIPAVKHKTYNQHKVKPANNNKPIDLFKAVMNDDSELVQTIIEGGADIDFVDIHKYTVLHYAAMKGYTNVIRVLLSNAADVNILGKYNMTALHCAAMNGFSDAVTYLLMSGANCFALDERGRTPVYLANQRKHVNIHRILIQAMKK